MKKLFLFSFITILLIAFSGCSKKPTDDISMSRQYLKSMGYTIIAENETSYEYVLEKDMLLKLPYQMYWGLQSTDAGKYFGSTIKTYMFTVQNHPLDTAPDNNKKQTNVWVMVCDNKIAGGYSLPDYDERHSGGVYSIDGKTLEEVTNMNFQD